MKQIANSKLHSLRYFGEEPFVYLMILLKNGDKIWMDLVGEVKGLSNGELDCRKMRRNQIDFICNLVGEKYLPDEATIDHKEAIVNESGFWDEKALPDANDQNPFMIHQSSQRSNFLARLAN